LLKTICDGDITGKEMDAWLSQKLPCGRVKARIRDVRWHNLHSGGRKLFYHIEIRRHPDAGPLQSWRTKNVWRRFSDFRSLYASLRKSYPGLRSSKSFPTRLAMFDDYPKIAAKRRRSLGTWLRLLLEEEADATMKVMLFHSHALLTFLGWDASTT